MHKIEIGKVVKFSAWNENFRAEISDIFLFFAERKLSLRTLIIIIIIIINVSHNRLTFKRFDCLHSELT